MQIKHDPFYISFGNTIRRLREERGLTREQLAERAGISSRHLGSIELAEKCVRPKTLYDLIRAIGVSADRVYYPEIVNSNTELDDITHLAATCTLKQQEFILDFIRLLKRNQS